MSLRGAQQQITAVVTSWEGVTLAPHRFGGVEYTLGQREIGHIHGDHMVDIPFPTKVREELVANGDAEPHHILPDSGWISFYLRAPGDTEKAIALFRKSYEIAMRQKPNR